VSTTGEKKGERKKKNCKWPHDGSGDPQKGGGSTDREGRPPRKKETKKEKTRHGTRTTRQGGVPVGTLSKGEKRILHQLTRTGRGLVKKKKGRRGAGPRRIASEGGAKWENKMNHLTKICVIIETRVRRGKSGGEKTGKNGVIVSSVRSKRGQGREK